LGNEGLSKEVQDAFFKAALPRQEFQSFLLGEYHHYWNQYTTLHNYDTFELAEVVQTGPDLKIALNLGAKPILYGDANFLRLESKFSYVWEYAQNALWETTLEAKTRLQDANFVNNFFAFQTTIGTPVIFNGGRFFGNFKIQARINDLDNYQLYLGGHNGLRGLPSNYYAGPYSILGNIEFRSLSFPLWVTRIGGVLFYDVGSAFSNWNNIEFTHDIGLGLRILLIQFNRAVLRIDMAVPVAGPIVGPNNFLFTFGFNQAF